MYKTRIKKIMALSLLILIPFGISYADDQTIVTDYINSMRVAPMESGILGDVFVKVFDSNGKIKEAFYDFVNHTTDGFLPVWKDLKLVDSEMYSTGGLIGIGTTTPAVSLDVAGDIRANNVTSSCIGNCGASLPPVYSGDSNVNGDLNVTGELKINGSYVTRQIVSQVNTANHSTTTAWKLGPTFATIPDFKAGSLVKLSYHMPLRNDATGWGGGYIEPQMSFDGGTTWNSLGSSGFDAVMEYGQSIGSYYNTIVVDPSSASDFSVTVRFYFKSYNGTVMINQSHSINTVSGTATIMSGNNGLQHYSKIIVEELY